MNKQFEEWFEEHYGHYIYRDEGFNTELTIDELPPCMQWGAYLEFFDSVGINIGTVYFKVAGGYFEWRIHYHSGAYGSEPTRPEAQQAAIKKAFEILEQ
jgi:hypothetical protein